MAEYNWQVGQKVFVHSGGTVGGMTLDEIARITPTGIIRLKWGTGSYRPSGSERTTDPWHRGYIEPATEKKQALVVELSEADFSKLTLPALERIKAIVDEARGGDDKADAH